MSEHIKSQDSDARRPPSRTRSSRPTTPLRPSSRSSFRDSAARAGADGDITFPLNTFEPAFAELADAVADLEANMMHFQLMHESLSRFNESFASFLYGLNMNAFCVDFPEAPVPESFRRQKPAAYSPDSAATAPEQDGETTFMTTDTTFIENPSTSKSVLGSAAPDSDGNHSRVPTASRGAGWQASGRAGGRGGGTGRQQRLARPRVRGLR